MYITWSVPWKYRWICIPKQDTASNVELSNNETHLFQNGERSNEVEYHPRAILYAFARVRVSWSCVWSCACGVRCLLSARLQNELGKLMQLLIYLWDLYHRQWCASWVFLSVLLVELGMTCVLVWGNWLWSVYTTKKFLKHLSISLFCQSFMCKSFKRRSIIPGESYSIPVHLNGSWSPGKCIPFWVCDVLFSVVTYFKFV